MTDELSTGNVFDKAVNQANNWVKDLMYELSWNDGERTYHALRATLQALRDRLSPEEAAHLGAQLPMLVRGFYYENWKPADKPLKIRHRQEFFDHVQELFSSPVEINTEELVRAVFKLLVHRISAGEIEDIRGRLPDELRELWPHSP